VTTAVAPNQTAPLLCGRYHFLLRRLHSLTGLVFGGYLVVHLLVNATLAQLGNVYQLQVNKIHELPLLPFIEWGFIYLPILYHIAYGIWITLTGQPNIGHYSYQRNWLYTLQRVSAVIIVLFMFFHVFSLKYGWFGAQLSFNPHAASASVYRHMGVSALIPWIIYPVGILASCFHLANGFWAAGITWGLTISAGAQKRWGMACAGLFALTMIFGFTALLASRCPEQTKLAPHAIAVQEP
jgi:succinate dehydrogenase / fumarate reductase, cytochrome b subunit